MSGIKTITEVLTIAKGFRKLYKQLKYRRRLKSI